MKVVDEETGQVIVEYLRPAYSFFKRLKGLMFQKHLDSEIGVHIKPCQSIHTFFMKFPIDVIYVDKNMKVVGIEESLSPGKIGKRFKDATSVIEVSAGKAANGKVKVGQTILLTKGEK